MLSGQTADTPLPTPQQYRNQARPAPQADLVNQAAEMLAGARRPVIICGGGIKNTMGHEDAMQLAETLHAPIITAPGHGDAIPHGFMLNAGQMGPRGNAVASRLAREADVILALGTRLGFNSTFYSYDNINEDAAIIQVEIEPTAIGRYFPVSLGIWGDARDTARQLTARLGAMADRQKAEAWVSTYKKEREDFLQARDRDAVMTNPIQPSGLFKAMRDVFPADSMVTMDAGTLCLQATDALQYGGPRSSLPRLISALSAFRLPAGWELSSPARPGHQPDGRWRFRHDHLGLSQLSITASTASPW